MKTKYDIEISDRMYEKKLAGLVNQFYKILPIREQEEPTLKQYLCSLQREMIGCKELMSILENDAQYLSLLSILEYMINHDCDIPTVRADVFRAIGIIKRMQVQFADKLGGGSHERVG